ncbi:MAG: DUF5667 domain-containing protein [Patescibacteria group bacterium]|nr:DUF5667 domain-containing protein [Patescibacteria group bacterium]
MGKSLITFLVVFIFVFSNSVFAAVNVSLLDSSLTPDSPFYFLKTWKEEIQLFFTFDAEQKARQYLHLADVRFVEYQKMIEKGKQEIADKTLQKYEDQLNRALEKAKELKDKGKDIVGFTKNIEETTVKHLQVLQENLAKVPEAAKQGLERAIEASQKGIEQIKGKIEKRIEKATSTSAIDVSDWQIYRNEEYGFEFKYPATWQQKEREEKTSNLINLSFVSPDLKEKDVLGGEIGYPSRSFTVSIITSGQRLRVVLSNVQTSPQYILQEEQKMGSTPITVGGVLGMYKKEYGYSSTDNLSMRATFPPSVQAPQIYNVWLEGTKEDKVANRVIFNQILSTFKFIEPSSKVTPAFTQEEGDVLAVQTTWGTVRDREWGKRSVSVSKVGDQWYVTVTYDGLHNDSTRAARFSASAYYVNGSWSLGEPIRTQQCWSGRGHQDFSAEPCL